MVHKILSHEVRPPSTLAGASVEPLDAIVARALASREEDRYETAEAMAIAIEDAIAPSLPRKVGEWVRDLASNRLTARADLVTRIESSSGSPSIADAVE